MSTHQTPARFDQTPRASEPGATGTGRGSPSGDSRHRQLSVAPTFVLDRGPLPWLTVQSLSTGPECPSASPAHPVAPTHELRAEHRAAGRGASCACEHRRGRGSGARGRGGP